MWCFWKSNPLATVLRRAVSRRLGTQRVCSRESTVVGAVRFLAGGRAERESGGRAAAERYYGPVTVELHLQDNTRAAHTSQPSWEQLKYPPPGHHWGESLKTRRKIGPPLLTFYLLVITRTPLSHTTLQWTDHTHLTLAAHSIPHRPFSIGDPLEPSLTSPNSLWDIQWRMWHCDSMVDITLNDL